MNDVMIIVFLRKLDLKEIILSRVLATLDEGSAL
jgi:hypothetical protein